MPATTSRDRAPIGWGSFAFSVWMSGGVAASALAYHPAPFAAAGLAALAALILKSWGAWTASGRFGAANAVTAVRIAAIAAIALGFSWLAPLAAVALVALVFALDGVDGWLARRTGTSSSFGAQLDVEADAYLVMSLTLLVWLEGIAGPWVLAAGLWRYAYTALIAVVPCRGQEPRSLFGRSVFALLLASLGGAVLAPEAVAEPLAAVGTILVSISFLRSIAWSLGLATSAGARSHGYRIANTANSRSR